MPPNSVGYDSLMAKTAKNDVFAGLSVLQHRKGIIAKVLKDERWANF
jgi:hypothetical protein